MRAAHECPRPWDISLRASREKLRPAFSAKQLVLISLLPPETHQLFSLHPPPSTLHPSPFTLHPSPFTTHQNLVQVVQHISVAHFRLFFPVFFCFLLFLKARFSGPILTGCLPCIGLRLLNSANNCYFRVNAGHRMPCTPIFARKKEYDYDATNRQHPAHRNAPAGHESP